MSEDREMFKLLGQSADADVVDAIERLVADAPDHQLCRINPLAFAARNGLRRGERRCRVSAWQRG